MKTWEVKLLAGNNGVIQTNVIADQYKRDSVGITFYKNPPDEELIETAFFPLSSPVSALLSVEDVTP